MTSYSDNVNFSYSIDSKILFIDSNDRDIAKWPNSSEFEITCPQVYNNVQSLNLLNIVLPNTIYNISDYLQNNKLVITISGLAEQIITLEDGYYDVETLRSSLENNINNKCGLSGNVVMYIGYNKVSHKFYFGRKNNSIPNSGFFQLKFETLFILNYSY